MPKKKNKTQNELVEESIDSVSTEAVVSQESTAETPESSESAAEEIDLEKVESEPEQVSIETSGIDTQDSKLEESLTPEPTPEPAPEPTPEPAPEPTPQVEKQEEVVEEKTSDLEHIAKAIVKADNNLNVSFVSFNRGTKSLLIKQSGGVHCFCRVVPRSRSYNGQEWEAEFLGNIPPQIHSKLVKTLKDIGVPDSKRLFFNPSGLL